MYYEDRKISIFKNFNFGLGYLNPKANYKKSHSLNIKQIHEVIVKGGGLHDVEDIKRKIEHIQTHSKEESVFIKAALPSFTVSADFEDSRTKAADKEYTQIIGFDFDKLSTAKVNEAIEKLKIWGGATLIFKSPSGKGIKVFINTDCQEKDHDLFYRCMAVSFKELFDLDADMQCIDYTRLCFFSYDKDAYFNEHTGHIPAKEVIAKYKPLVKVVESNSETLDIINYDAVNTDNIKTIFYGFTDQLRNNGIDWIDGKRNGFLMDICKLKRFGITYNECLTELMTFIDGNYTSEYTSKSIPQKLAYNWKHYHNKFDIAKPTKNNSLLINDYLTEQKEYIKKELLSKRIIFINAPTGSGKTTLIKQLAKELNLKTDIIMPTTALVEQQQDIKGITGKKPLNAELLNTDILACCYNSINKVADRQSKLLVIDEAHSLVSDYTFKSGTIHDIQRNINRYDYVVYLSGSILTLDGYYTEDNLLSFEKKNRFSYDYQIIKLDEGVTDKDYFINGIEKNKLNVFYLNDKSILDKLYIYLTEKGYTVAYISKDNKDKSEYKGIVENSSLNGYDVLLTTCIIQAGVNINECDREAVITYGRRSNLIDYIQFTARFRTNKPKVKIIHNGKLGPLHVLDLNQLIENANLEIKYLEDARKINEKLEYSFNPLVAEKIVRGLDLVYQDVDGKYTIDNFALLYHKYDTLNRSLNSNIRILNHYLSLFNFTEINNNSISIDEDETKQLKKVGRNYTKEKKVKIDKIIEDILSGSYIFNQAKDKVTKDIESKYIYLLQYLSDKDIKANRKLLTSDSALNLYQSRVTYMLAATEIQSKKAVSAKVYTEYHNLQNLDKAIQVNTTYSNQELKDIIFKCGYTTDNKNYINNSLKVLFEYELTKDRRSYHITGKVNLCDYITSKPVIINIDDLFSTD